MALRGDHINSIIGEGSIFEGKFYIQGSLEINGKFEGDIKTEGQIIIGKTGKVKTNVVARKVVIGGTLIGNIKASDEIVLLETGRILGDVSTPVLNMQKGVVVQGRINITGGQKKETKKIIEESFSTGPVMPSLTTRIKKEDEDKKSKSKEEDEDKKSKSKE